MDRQAVFNDLLARFPELPAQGLELRKPGADQWAALVLNSYGDGYPYKLQCFGIEGLEDHRVFTSFEETLRAAVEWGYTEHARGSADALVRSAAWQRQYLTAFVPPPRRLPHGIRTLLAVLAVYWRSLSGSAGHRAQGLRG